VGDMNITYLAPTVTSVFAGSGQPPVNNNRSDPQRARIGKGYS
jgi:hypothetical protein